MKIFSKFLYGFTFLWFALVVILCSGPVSAEDPTSGQSDDKLLEWIKEQAVFLESDGGRDSDPEKWKLLDEELAGKRIVFLGEPDHYVKEKYDYRLRMIDKLYERGWCYIGMEMGPSDGIRIDRYLETGDEEFIEQMSVLGYKGNRRPDRNYRLQGFDALDNDEFKQSFKRGETSFLKSLRALSENGSTDRGRLHWFGFDVDVVPGSGYEDARELLKDVENEPLVIEILASMELVGDESIGEEKKRIDALREFITDHATEVEGILGPAGFRTFGRLLRELSRSLEFFEVAQEGPFGNQWMSAMVERETWMFQRLDEIIEALPEDAKIILMGHNYHLSKDSDHLSFTSRNSTRVPMWRSIGTYLAETRTDEVYSIWMLYDRGKRGNVLYGSGFQAVPSDPKRIEHVLAKAGTLFLLPLNNNDPRKTRLERTVNFVQNGSAGSGLLCRQADALYFVAEVSVP